MADLPETEAAIVTEGGCSRLSLLLPNFADQEEMPRLVLALTACFIRLDKDPAFLEEQLDWMDEWLATMPLWLATEKRLV